MNKVVGFLAGTLCLICVLTACEDNLISSPSGNGTNIYNNSTLTAPKDLKASQGGYRSINLSWSAVSGALRYKIYASDSIYEDDFVLFSETEKNSSTSKSISNLNSGLTKYFKVTAVDADEKEGPASTIVCGSTLATPVITSVEQDSDSDETSVTVNWWMENCTAETYYSSIQYEVVCYTDEKGSATAGSDPFITDGSLSAQITGLSPNTTYYFQVIASLQGGAYEEKSDILDSETARKLTPEKISDFAAGQGESTDCVTLSWTLPSFVDIKEGSTYARRPVYFKIFRKLSTDSAFDSVPYIAYIGSNCNSSTGAVSSYISSKTVYTFNAQDCSTNNSLLTIEAGESVEENSLYPNYISGYKITFTDKNVLRNNRYDYKIQPYTDYYYDENTSAASASSTSYSKLTTSSSSAAEESGWPLGKTSFSVGNPVYIIVYAEDGVTAQSYSGASLSFEFTFNDSDLESNYKYILSRKRVTLDASETVEYLTKEFTSIDELNSYTDEIKPLPSMNGRYSYSVIIKSNASQTNVETVTSSKSRYITEDLNPLVLENFAVSDGYLSKYDISFSATAGNTYIVKECSVNSESESDWTEIINYVCTESSDYSYEYIPEDIVSGETRWFKADVYKTESAEKGDGADAVECGTLGTPEVSISDISYEGMTVSFAAVNKADTYTVTYVYDNDTDSLALDSDSAGQSVTLTSDDADEYGNFEIQFNEIAGYNNAQYAGLPLKVNVTALNSSVDSDNEVSVSESMKLFGPAATVAGVSQGTYSGKINVTWDAFDGAGSYIVIRRFYDSLLSPAAWSDDVITYWIDASTCELSEVNQKSASASSVSLSDGVYTLTDLVTEEIFTSSDYKEVYRKQQARLAWGQKFEYIVVPLKETDKIGGTYASGILDIENGASYSGSVSAVSKTGFALGYGLKVNASKGWETSTLNKEDSADNTSIYVSWSKPEVPSGDVVYYVYRYDGSSWEEKGQTSDLYYSDTSAAYGKVYRYLVGMSCGNARSYPAKNENERDYNISYYDEHADSNYSDRSINEGWVLSQPKVTSANQSDSLGTTEKLIWSAAQIDDTSNYGIDGYVIEVISNDLSDWTQVAAYSFDTADTSESYSYSFDGSACDATKILRDYKHFYRVRSYVLRDSKYCYSAPTEFTFGTEDEYIKWGTRAPSDEEMVKCINLIIGDALFQCGISSGGDRTCTGSTGTFTITHSSATKTVTWGTGGEKYTHIFRGGTTLNTTSDSTDNSFTSPWTITIADVSSRAAVDGNTLYYLPQAEVAVECSNGLDSYKGTFTVSAGTMGSKGWTALSDGVKLSWICAFTRDNGYSFSITESDEDTFLKWFPYNIGTGHDSKVTQFDDTVPVYVSPWW
ncbi:hypothetical protein [Treponema sp.]|uniref:hypothetical protein n=1 Tax=Treponema sp. TaxID=166 RepID=UPI0025DE3265|nr:hypothetical protein [Treponema sp.]MCR5219020.1 hypothetical protein [Treponema sp.]